MAEVSKVIFGDQVILDISNDTVTPSDLRAGVTAHGSDGETIIGELVDFDAEEF